MKFDVEIPKLLAVMVLAVVVATLSIALPATAQQAAPASGSFLGAVLISDDAEAASEFYAAIFGWDMEQAKDGGFAVRHKGRMIAGISPLDKSDGEVEESFWLVGITVEDIDASLRSAKKGNAKIYEDAHRVSEYGRFAVIADRQKAPVLLIEPGVKPLGRGKDHGSWVWAELWTNDVEDAVVFYADVVGVDHETTDRSGEDYHLFSSQNKPRTGIIEIPPELEMVEPGWAPYVAVSDLGATLGKVKELGGRVVFGEIEHPADASVALILDPSGAALFLYQIGSSGEAK
jgi:predicted enzyme related to lactoylglutathione lyase